MTAPNTPHSRTSRARACATGEGCWRGVPISPAPSELGQVDGMADSASRCRRCPVESSFLAETTSVELLEDCES